MFEAAGRSFEFSWIFLAIFLILLVLVVFAALLIVLLVHAILNRKKVMLCIVSTIIMLIGASIGYVIIDDYNAHWNSVPDVRLHKEDYSRVVDFIKQFQEELDSEDIYRDSYMLVIHKNAENELYITGESEIIPMPEDVQKSLCAVYESFRNANRRVVWISVLPSQIIFIDDAEHQGTGMRIIYTNNNRRPKNASAFHTKRLQKNWFAVR